SYLLVPIRTYWYTLVRTRTHTYSLVLETQRNYAQTKAFSTCDPKQFRSDQSISHVRPKAIPLRQKHFPRATQSNSAQTKAFPTCDPKQLRSDQNSSHVPVCASSRRFGANRHVPVRTNAYQCLSVQTNA